MTNVYSESLEFEVPPIPGGSHWRRLIDTSLPTPLRHRRAEGRAAGRESHIPCAAVLCSRVIFGPV
jgi:hypothetical protein